MILIWQEDGQSICMDTDYESLDLYKEKIHTRQPLPQVLHVVSALRGPNYMFLGSIEEICLIVYCFASFFKTSMTGKDLISYPLTVMAIPIAILLIFFFSCLLSFSFPCIN